MLTTAFAALALAFGVGAQITTLDGTWSSGSGAVLTGGSFCSPADMKFDYPVNTGISYSFLPSSDGASDGFFEEAQYRYDSNASNPKCIRGKIIWQHGKYVVNSDGSIDLTPFHQDGRIQVQDPCAAVTNLVTYYDENVNFKAHSFAIEPHTGKYTLNLNAFDGSKLPPLYLVYRPPNMLPTRPLTGTNSTGQLISRRDLQQQQPEKRSAAKTVVSHFGTVGVLAATTMLLSAVL